MKAHYQEVTDSNNIPQITTIWIYDYEPNQMPLARKKLDDLLTIYAGRDGHNVYQHTEPDTVAATIIFDVDKLKMKERTVVLP